MTIPVNMTVSNGGYSSTNTNIVLFEPKQDNDYLNKRELYVHV